MQGEGRRRLESLQGKHVLPGEPLAVVEEFLPGLGVYVAGDGTIYSASVGRVQLELHDKRISVVPLKPKPRIPRRGVTAHGYVQAVPREDLAVIKIIADDKLRPYNPPFTALLHISQASDRFSHSIYDVVRLGDVLRLQVLSDEAPFIVSIKQPQYGVVLAFCSRCGGVLVKHPGQDMLICSQCGNREYRKVSLYYMAARKASARAH